MMLDNIKILLGFQDNSKDGQLNVLIAKVTRVVLNYCNLTELPTDLESVVEDVVIKKYNRLGSEGAKRESTGPISVEYDEILTDDLKEELNQFRKLKVV